MNVYILTTGSQGRHSTADAKTAVHFSIACFTLCPLCQLALVPRCWQWVCLPLLVLLFWCDQINKPRPEQKVGKRWHQCCVSASLGHPLQLPCLAQQIDNSWKRRMGFVSTIVSLPRAFSIWLDLAMISEVADGQVGKQWQCFNCSSGKRRIAAPFLLCVDRYGRCTQYLPTFG